MLASARAQQSHTPPDAQRVWRSAPYKYGYLIEAFNQISLICPISLIVNYNLPSSPCPGSPAAKQTQTSITSSSWPQRRTLQHRKTWNHIHKLQRKIFIANQPMPFVHFIKNLIIRITFQILRCTTPLPSQPKLQMCTPDNVSTPGGDGEWAVNERIDGV